MMNVLRLVRLLGLPDLCVCASFIRSKAWDHPHMFDSPTPLSDVDIVYFDINDKDESEEKKYKNVLRELDSSIPWSVENRARMHAKNGHVPYVSTTDGLASLFCNM